MQDSSKEFRIQRRIGWAFTAAFAVLVLLQMLRIVLFGDGPEHLVTTFERFAGNDVVSIVPYAIGCVLLGLFFFLTSLRDSPLWRSLQVAAFMLIGAAVLLFSTHAGLAGAVFLVTGVIVGYQYGMLRYRIRGKLAAVIILAVISRTAGALLYREVGLFDVLYTLLALLVFVFIYLSLFYEQIQEQRARERAIRRQLSERDRYSQLGRNVTSILHNMKNVYFALNHGLAMLHNRSDEELRQVKVDRTELIASLRSAMESFAEKIENIVSYTGGSRRADKEQIALLWHTARLVDIFCIDKEFKQKVRVDLEIPDGLRIEAPPVKLNQMLENLLMNSWEAIREERGSGVIRFSAEETDSGWVIFRIEDDGGGIPGFESSELNGASVLSGDFFSPGRSSKPDGSGHGLAYVIETMRELGGDVVITSIGKRGATVQLCFPPPASGGTGEPETAESAGRVNG